MIWSAVKIILFVALVAALTWAAGWLSETDGGVLLVFAGWEMNLGPLQAAILLAVLALVIWLVLKALGLVIALLRFANGDETALSRYFDRRGQERGFEALSEGMIALASGNGRLAMAKAARAERFLRRPELTNLLSAQAAEITGDRRKAEQIYRRLLADDRTRFVGIRGLMRQRLEEGDTGRALKLAERAFALKPQDAETGDILLQLQAKDEDWEGARKTLAEKLRQGALPRDVHRRRDAVLALSEARDVFRHGTTIEAREKAIEANRLSPDLVPAAVMAAQAYISDEKPRYAERVLKKAWAAQPHPDLAATYAAIEPDEDSEARRKRFRALLKVQPDHAETRLLDAELSVAAKDFDDARRALGNLAETHPTARSLALMAAIARGRGDADEVVRSWLARAVNAPRGPQWICDNCQTVHGQWAPVCTACGGFDTLSWREKAEDGEAGPVSTEVLMPLVARSGDAPRPDMAEVTDDESDEVVDGGQAPAGEDRPG